MSLLTRLAGAYRRTGADLPFGDPLPSHGCEMEGWFWRISDAASGRVAVALCGVNRHPDGDWATVAVALHPGGIVRAAALGQTRAETSRFALEAGGGGSLLTATNDQLHIQLDDLHLDWSFADPFVWPKAFAGGGVFSAVPFLNQYWHPYRLGGTATGKVEVDGDSTTFNGAKLYAERNWGAGFPERWWWGQAHDFGDSDVSVAFSGGLLELGPIRRDVAGVVARVGNRVIRITPPWLVKSALRESHWALSARSIRYHIELEGDGVGIEPHVLPVPLPAERRNIDTDFEHLAGTIHCTISDYGRMLFQGTSELAGLEVGSRP